MANVVLKLIDSALRIIGLTTIVCLSVAQSSCSVLPFTVIDSDSTDEEFRYYKDLYQDYKKEYTGSSEMRYVSIKFFSLVPPAIGVCYRWPNGRREVFIDPRYWFDDYVTDSDRELLIFHELGHCDLERGHTDPSSIMEASHMGYTSYEAYKKYYLKELFGVTKRKIMPSTFNTDFGETHTCVGTVHVGGE